MPAAAKPKSKRKPSAVSRAKKSPFVNVHEAKTHFSRLLASVERGGSVIIARGDHPVARLVPLEENNPPPPRNLGLDRGLYTVPEDFNTPMTEEEFFNS